MPVVYGYLGILVLTFLFLLLKVVASGIWVAPGDSEEISVAFSQSLRNCIERALSGISYMRFGDVFSKFSPQSEEYLRYLQPLTNISETMRYNL
jgi:mediator of RNA polymerase II transcription subunit 13